MYVVPLDRLSGARYFMSRHTNLITIIFFSVVHDLALHGETPSTKNQDRPKLRHQRRNSVSVCETPTRQYRQNDTPTRQCRQNDTPKRQSRQVSEENAKNKNKEKDTSQKRAQVSRLSRYSFLIDGSNPQNSFYNLPIHPATIFLISLKLAIVMYTY